jgi:hypothetical protein
MAPATSSNVTPNTLEGHGLPLVAINAPSIVVDAAAEASRNAKTGVMIVTDIGSS